MAAISDAVLLCLFSSTDVFSKLKTEETTASYVYWLGP